MLRLPDIPEHEVEFIAIRAQGAGGQHVNKVSSAIHLRLDIRLSSLPDPVKERLLALRDQRVTKDGVVVIKAQVHRSQEKNKAEALRRLQDMIAAVTLPPTVRKPTTPPRSSQRRRLERKTRHSQLKTMRGQTGRRLLD